MPEPKPAPEPPKAALAGGAPELKTARAEPRKFELPRLPQPKRIEQTLIQLELPPEMASRQDIRVPTVVIWDAKTHNLPRPPARKFIAPTRKEVVKASPSLLAEPKLEVPNQERNIADLNFSAVRATDVPLLPTPPSSTTPIRIVSSAPSGPIPQSAALDAGAHEPTNVISIPDMPLPPAKVLIIPAINQVATAHMAGGGDQGFGSEAAGGNVGGGQAEQGGGGKGAGQGAASGAGAGTSLTGSSPGTGGGGAGVSGAGGRGAGSGVTGGGIAGTGSGAGTAGAGAGNGAGAGAGNGKGSGAGDGAGPGSVHVARIVRPQDGHFAAVVLGSSATQAYPEAVGVLGGRLVYTVYLRVGTKKSWIMQYCLPRAVEQAVKVKGAATPVEPPFPFLILRPDLELAPETDYVIVHGIVSASGKFEQLSIVGMTGFAQERLLLSSLELWQFRPAARDGQATTVEILLIIPREEV